MKKENGITLIALVVIIIVLLILAGISLNYATGDTNLIQKSKEAMFKSDAKDLKDMWDARVAGIDATNINYDNVEDVIGVEKIPESLRGIFAIENGKLVYKSDIDSLTDEQKSWLFEVGINQAYIVPLNIVIKAAFSQVIQSVNSKSADVVFVLDVSQSMTSELVQQTNNNRYRYQAMFTALNSAIPTILDANEKNRIAIVTYADRVKYSLDFGHYEAKDDSGFFKINTLPSNAMSGNYATTNIKNVTNTGLEMGLGTATRSGMAKACLLLKNRNSSDPVYGNNEPIIILLTDGEPNVYTNTVDIANRLNNIADENGQVAGTSYNACYWTVKLGSAIKDYYRDQKLQIITINFNESVLAAMVLNPTGTNQTNARINAIKNSEDYIYLQSFNGHFNNTPDKNRWDAYKEQISDLQDYSDECDDLAAAFNRGDFKNYSDKAYSGEFSTEELTGIFDEISIEIAKATDVELGEHTEGAILNVTNDMTYTNPETGEVMNLKLDTNGAVQVSVVASVYNKPLTEDGQPTIKVDPTTGKEMSITFQKTYTVGQIMSGVDPNLSYTNGNIQWNIRADFDERYTASRNNVRNLALQKLIQQGYRPDTTKDEVADIGYIEIIVPVVIDDGT